MPHSKPLLTAIVESFSQESGSWLGAGIPQGNPLRGTKVRTGKFIKTQGKCHVLHFFCCCWTYISVLYNGSFKILCLLFRIDITDLIIFTQCKTALKFFKLYEPFLFFLTSLLDNNCFTMLCYCCCITKWVSYMYTYIPISPPSCVSLPSSLSHHCKWTKSTELISLCYAAVPH